MRLARKGLPALLKALTLSIFVIDIAVGVYLISTQVIPYSKATIAGLVVFFFILLVMVIWVLRSLR